MGRFRWLLLMCCSLLAALAGWSGEDAVDSGRTLSQASAHLVEAQSQLQSACASAGVAVPRGLGDVLIVRRTIAADWQRRLDSAAVRADDAALVRFTGELENLVTGLQQLANLAQQLGDAPRRFPHCLMEPAFARYRTLVTEAVDQGMQAMSAGRMRDQVAPSAWYQRQARHTALLSLIEAEHAADERYAKLPRDDRWLVEYREHLLLTRTTLEQTFETVKEDQSLEHQAILDAYTRLLDARVEQAERIASSGLEAEAPEIAAFRRAGEDEIKVLDRQLALARSSGTDQDERGQLEARASRDFQHAERLKAMAEEWLSFESERREQAMGYAEVLDQAPAELAKAKHAAIDALAEAQRQAQGAFSKALETEDVEAAMRAQHAVERVRQQRDRLWLHLEEDLTISERETVWRAHAKDPAMVERLRQWDERRAAVLAARHAAEEAADAALAAQQASQRADLVAEQAQERADALEMATENKEFDLTDLQQALDEMVDLRAGDAPAVVH